ncbi:MAG: zinc ribbon domain-containing protein [Chloroflexales bacterium]|nr:zinc ribbon domain-containing protein [Chloroflexales bacterium]
MEQRMYQRTIDPDALAQHLLDTWDQGDTVAQALEGDEGIIVQVGQRSGGFFSDEPRSAVTLALEPVGDGLRVTLGEQQWYRDGGGRIMVGGLIGFFPFFFTWPLGGGRDEPVDPQVSSQVWESVERYVQQHGVVTGATTRLPQPPEAVTGATTRLAGIYCPSCGTESALEAERCRECGTYLQARACPACGVSNPATANFCMRCGSSLNAARAVHK